MCGPRVFDDPSHALALAEAALDHLAHVDVSSIPVSAQAEVLRGLERAESRHTAARARFLGVFASQSGPESDGSQSARVWLTWQTRISAGAAAGAVAWMRRLAGHFAVEAALACGEISTSWARQICAWTDLLPADAREDADRILLEATRGGAHLRDLAGLAEQMYERSLRDRPGGDDSDDGSADRYFRLGLTFRGAGRAEGDLTPECAAGLSAVLNALSKKTGPEDTRTTAQRRHDALSEACRRLIAAGLLPGRAGQPTQIQVHVSLAELRSMPGAAQLEEAWIAAAATQPGWLTGPAADAAACDATVVPVVTGHLDPAALDQLTSAFLAAHGLAPGFGTGSPSGGSPPGDSPGPASADPASADPASADPASADPASADPGSRGCPGGSCRCPASAPLSAATRERLKKALLALAIQALSGPGGLAATLRANVGSGFCPPAAKSLPLDIGAATEAIPAHLRRAVSLRHPHCAFPGCDQPASVCEVHHLVPRSRGGRTALPNLVPLCQFHHLTVVHRWGWTLRLDPDGTTTATSPDGRVYRSHAPPRQAA